MLCTSGFVDEDMFSLKGASGPESKTTLCFDRRVRQVAALGAKLLSTIARFKSGLILKSATFIYFMFTLVDY